MCDVWWNVNHNSALDLAVQHKTHIDTVLHYRSRYLAGLDQKETDKRFLQLAADVKVDRCVLGSLLCCD